MCCRSLRAVRFAVAGAVLLMGAHGAAAQVTDAVAAAVGDEAWVHPRTAWGDPDLQGIWNNTAWNATPLEFQTAEDIAETERARRARPRLPGAASVGYDGDIWGEGARANRSTPPIDLTHLIVDPANGKLPPLTADAQQRWDARREARRGLSQDEPRPGAWVEDVTVWMRCISRGLPDAMFPRLYNNVYHILQTPGYVVIVYEMIHDARIIPIDGRPPLPTSMRQWLGDSRGRWEGDTLVVETKNFVGYEFSLIPHGGGGSGTYRGAGRALNLTERFTRVSDEFIDYRFTVNDPNLYTAPWTGAVPLTTIESPEGILEYACHEGNYAIVTALGGALARDAAQQESAP